MVEINLKKRGVKISNKDTKPVDNDGACIINNWADDKINEGKWSNMNMF